MADKQITELPANSGVTNETLFPAYQPGAVEPAQKVTGAQFRAFAEDAAKKTAGSIARGGTFTPQFNDATGYLSWTNDMGLPNPDPVQLEGVSSVNGKTGAVTVFNPNLLDNWYFADPVNQRGQTEYAGTGYGIDRWRTNYSGDTVSITDNGVKNTIASTSGGWHLHQIIDGVSDLVGSTVTVSFLFAEVSNSLLRPIVSFRNASDSEISNARADTKTGLVTASAVVPNGTAKIRVGLYAYSGVASGDFATVKAIKLELGSEQTLAHQENGNWVLNDPPPDKGMELLKCCMSTADSSDTYANNKVTANAVGALAQDGSNSMTGHLTIDGSDGDTQLIQFAGNTTLRNIKDSANYTDVEIAADKRLVFNVVENGRHSGNTIYHQGNKPSGSYTGNGDATARTIETGGIASAILVDCDYGFVIVRLGAIGADALNTNSPTMVSIPYANARASETGTLRLATTHRLLNENGRKYTYFVL